MSCWGYRYPTWFLISNSVPDTTGYMLEIVDNVPLLRIREYNFLVLSRILEYVKAVIWKMILTLRSYYFLKYLDILAFTYWKYTCGECFDRKGPMKQYWQSSSVIKDYCADYHTQHNLTTTNRASWLTICSTTKWKIAKVPSLRKSWMDANVRPLWSGAGPRTLELVGGWRVGERWARKAAVGGIDLC